MASKNEAKSADKAAAASDPESAKAVSFVSPWGSKVTVAAELADTFKDAGYKISK